MELLNQDINGCYKIIEKLSKTGVYSSWKAIGLYSPLIFNLKFLNQKDKEYKLEDIIRFEKQILGIYKLNHPNIKRIFEIDKYNDYRYISLEYIEGIPLSVYLSDNHRPSYKESLNIIYEICKGIEAAHRNGVIHKALNPSNIFIEINNNKIDKIKIGNFGFSELNFYHKKLNKEELKNAYFIAPEGFGYFNRSMDERSDLYSIGLIFHRLLLGEQFLQNASIDDIIRKIISIDLSVPLLTIKDKIPAVLIDIIKKLISKNPENRYKSASGLLIDIERLINNENDFTLGVEDETFNPTFDSEIINMKKEMQTLLKLSTQAQGSTGSICIINGEHGYGKTKLIEEFSNSVIINNGYFIDGSFFSCPNKYSFYAFNKALDKFYFYYQKLSTEKQNKIKSEVNKLITNENRFILKIFHSIKLILDDIELKNYDSEKEIDKKFINKIALFICELSKTTGFMVILLDNIQWMDADSLYLFNEITNIINNYPLLIICSCIQSEFLKNKKNISSIFNSDKITKLFLNVMDKKNTLELLKNILGENSSKINHKILNHIFELSRGNPFYTIEILKFFIDEEIIYPVINEWESSIEKFDKISNFDINNLILKKIQTLTKEEFDILTIISIIDIDLKIEVIFKLCRYYFEDILSTIDNFIEKKILNLRVTGTGCYLYMNDIIKSILRDKLYEGKSKNQILDIANLLENDLNNENTNLFNLLDKLYICAKGFSHSDNLEKGVLYLYRFGLMMKEICGFYEAKRYMNKSLEIMENYYNKSDKLYSDITNSLNTILKYLPEEENK